MKKNNNDIAFNNRMPDWITIQEAIELASKSVKICESEIYRYALTGKIQLSIYFQSPIAFKKNKDNK
ncbi:hypothetical protein [Pectobacterium carotovorum]|uniref:hypothetical protein n=1 Tax=Enterobacterales TaxID=91347 RepID=UPI002E348B66|nr:hypothetical protein [Pectobacterium carotovorum]